MKYVFKNDVIHQNVCKRPCFTSKVLLKSTYASKFYTEITLKYRFRPLFIGFLPLPNGFYAKKLVNTYTRFTFAPLEATLINGVARYSQPD